MITSLSVIPVELPLIELFFSVEVSLLELFFSVEVSLLELFFSVEDGKNTIKVSHYVDDLGDAWASWAAVYYPGDAVTLSELQEAMDSLTIQAK